MCIRDRVWGHGPLHGNVSKEGANRVVWEIEDLPRRTFLEGRVTFPAQLVPEAANLSGREGLPGILAEEEMCIRDRSSTVAARAKPRRTSHSAGRPREVQISSTG